jgi:ABC-type lipoprotein release transport system permease subunit
MGPMKRTVSVTGLVGLGILAALGLYVVCVLVTFILGGLFYSVTLGAIVAAFVALVILAYLWGRRRNATSWPVVVAMVASQLAIAALAIQDSPSTALMLFR